MALKLTKIVDIASLYDDFSMYKSVLQSIVDGKTKQSVTFAQCNMVPSNLFTVMSCMLSLRGSNAFPERVSSLMNAKWRGDRNRMLVSLVKSELRTFINYDLDCRRFYSFALAEPKLLQAAASNEKYVYKNKAKKAKNVTSLSSKFES
jgi:hypothetical protein